MLTVVVRLGENVTPNGGASARSGGATAGAERPSRLKRRSGRESSRSTRRASDGSQGSGGSRAYTAKIDAGNAPTLDGTQRDALAVALENLAGSIAGKQSQLANSAAEFRPRPKGPRLQQARRG